MDQQITCCECRQVFVFSDAEQEFYASKEMKPPKRCRPCRRARRLRDGDRSSRPSFPELRASSPELRSSSPELRASSSGDVGAASSGDLPPSRDSRPSRPSRPRLDRPRFAITCGQCGAAADVPFRPAEGRQVFCQACYRARRGSDRLLTDGLDVDDADLGIVES
jgi:CxxC-x17-CxxC domain-containing protein